MQSPIDLDWKCNAELRHEIGERLRREFPAGKTPLPPQLTILLDRLRARDEGLTWVASPSIASTGEEAEVSDVPPKQQR